MNYTKALQTSLYFFDVQKSNGGGRISWRAPAFTKDSIQNYLFDAGDHVAFNFPLAASFSMLIYSILEFRAGYEKANCLDHAMEHVHYVVDFIRRCRLGKHSYIVQVGDGNIDHKLWAAAEVSDDGIPRPIYIIDEKHPGSDIAAEYAALFAGYGILTQDVYFYELANELFSFAENFKGKYTDSLSLGGFYTSNSIDDELAWGAAWLLRAARFFKQDASAIEKKAIQYYDVVKTRYKWTHCWDDKTYGARALMMSLFPDNKEYQAQSKEYMDYWTYKLQKTPAGLAYLNNWGVLRYAAATAFIFFLSNMSPEHEKFARRQIDYILGDNPLKMSYLIGYGEKYPLNPHHRSAHGPWNNNIQTPPKNRHTIYGALVGGPGVDDKFSDDRSNFINNEVAVDYNASLVCALACMAMKYGTESDESFVLPEEEPTGEFEVKQESVSPTDTRFTIMNKTAWPARRLNKPTLRLKHAADKKLTLVYPKGTVNTQNGVTTITFDVELKPAGEDKYKRELVVKLQ